MFTGLITDVGRVRTVTGSDQLRIVIESSICQQDTKVGASIACSGACLTVVEFAEDWFSCDVSGETLSCTTLGGWKSGAEVNLERSLKVGDELGGHLVLGHVDGVARIVERRADGSSSRFSFDAPHELAHFIAPKGAVALDGVSLTVNEVDGDRFGVNIIPHTAKQTTFGAAQPGDYINLEIDMLARYVARLSQA
jgi:riboflavin synthase